MSENEEKLKNELKNERKKRIALREQLNAYKSKLKNIRRKELKQNKMINEICTTGSLFLANFEMVIAIFAAICSFCESEQIRQKEIEQNKRIEMAEDELDESYFDEYTSNWYHFGNENEYIRFHYYYIGDKNEYIRFHHYQNPASSFKEISYLEIGEKTELGIQMKYGVSFNKIENRITNKEKIDSNFKLAVSMLIGATGNCLFVNHLFDKDEKEKIEEKRKKRIKN